MTSISTMATQPPDGWYFVTVIGAVPPGQWVNMNHVMRVIANGTGTTLVFVDGNTSNITDPLPIPTVQPI